MKKSISSLFRDTALEVAMMTNGADVPNMPLWQARCVETIETLCQKMRASSFPEEVIQEVSYAQCALLDETALRHLPENLRGDWEIQPLQVRFFNTYNAGEVVYERIESLLRKPEPNQDLVEVYTIILGLGFLGRYFKIDDDERMRLVSELDSRYLKRNEAPALFILGRGNKGEAFDWRNLSPLWWLGVAAIVPLCLWFFLDRRLDEQILKLLNLGS